MIGYAPFLGQVRLVSGPMPGRRANLGQYEQGLKDLDRDGELGYPCATARGVGQPYADALREKIIAGETLASDETEYLRRLHVCLTAGRSKDDLLRAIGQAEDKLGERPDCDPDGTVRAYLDRAKAWLATARPGDSFPATEGDKIVNARYEACIQRAPTSGAPPSEGLPTWAYVVGGLAAVGLVAFLVRGS